MWRTGPDWEWNKDMKYQHSIKPHLSIGHLSQLWFLYLSNRDSSNNNAVLWLRCVLFSVLGLHTKISVADKLALLLCHKKGKLGCLYKKTQNSTGSQKRCPWQLIIPHLPCTYTPAYQQPLKNIKKKWNYFSPLNKMKEQKHKKYFQHQLRKPIATGHGWVCSNLRQRQNNYSVYYFKFESILSV